MTSFLEGFPKNQNIYYLSEKDDTFENTYVAIRTKEQRIYSTSELKSLPFHQGIHQKEWALRAETLKYFLKYLKNKKLSKVLEIGCGNGWLAHQVAQNTQAEVVALDLNNTELLQGIEVFDHPRLFFVYGDIFETNMDNFKQQFDLVYMGASMQYFSNFSKLVNRIQSFLSNTGEIHIFDSPFYPVTEKSAAQQRSRDYYTSLGFPDMANYYFHHTWDDLAPFNSKILYKPSVTQRILQKRKNPFPWVKIT